jgi:glycosyltransferase involved in cell wall biosynthesis
MDVSIIICTYNGANKIEKTLASILAQKATCSYELIIVNNASSDSTAELVQKFLIDHQTDHFKWKLIYEPIPGLINARLAGMKEAAADIILFCDDDNILCDSYIQSGFEIMSNNPKIGVLGGLGIPEFESEKPDWFDTYYHSYAVGAQADKDGKIEHYPAEVYGAGSFFRKAPLKGFYDLGFKSIFKGRTGKVLSAGDDVEWCYLLQLAGYEIWYDSRLQFNHLMPTGRLQWGYYVKMKAGIAGGASSFVVYSFIMRDKMLTPLKFNVLSFRKFIYFLLLFIKHSFKYLMLKKDRENFLNKEVSKSKMMSFLSATKPKIHHYNLLKNITNNI